MAYLRDTEHDVFLSYAHVDNTPEREDEKGWVEQFERQLSVRLLKRFGEEVDVWRDPELGRAQLFDPVIEAAVRGSGVLVALISSRYLPRRRQHGRLRSGDPLKPLLREGTA